MADCVTRATKPGGLAVPRPHLALSNGRRQSSCPHRTLDACQSAAAVGMLTFGGFARCLRTRLPPVRRPPNCKPARENCLLVDGLGYLR